MKLICLFAAIFSIFCITDLALAANIKVLPSASRVSPGESFYIDISVENIPSNGLDTVQFKLNVDAPGSVVAGVSDITNSGTGDVSVSTPLTIGLPTLNHSGISEFFWNASGPYGILVMDNEELKNGKGLYAFAHTNNSTLPSGNGSIARFYFAVGKDVVAEKIEIFLTDVALLNAGNLYQLDTNTGATIELRCMTKSPDLLGLSLAEAQSALQQANLIAGNIYEIDNQSGTYALNKVLVQSSAAGTSILCGTSVNLAINTPPSEVGNAAAIDKANDESGTVILSWIPSASADTAGYRIYLISGSQSLLKEIRNPVAAGAEISGLTNGQVSQLKVTAFDNFGNESQGVIISATPIDDIAPRITVSGVTEGAFYSYSVLPVIDVQDANLSAKEMLLNGIAYAMALIGIEGNYTLKITATDSSGNATVKEIHFVIDKTPPVISVSGIEKGKYYSADVSPIVSVSDPNIQSVESLLNGSAYASGTVITAEGTYELKINAVDKAGNQSSDTYIFYIDKTKPASSISVGEPKFTNNTDLFVKNSTLFTLSGKDEGAVNSGLGKLEYKLNNSEWNVYSAPFALTGLSDGIVVINYRAVDSAGNAEEFHTLTVKTDNTPPVTTAIVGAPKYVGADGVVSISPLTEITLTVIDELSGVNKTEYMIDSGQWTAYAPFKIIAEGRHTIKYRSMDNLGNVEIENVLEVVVDTTPPVSTINIGTPQYKKDEILYISPSTEISVSALDSGSTAVRIEYSIDNTPFAEYTAPITLASYSEGAHTIKYRSTDNIGNVEADKTVTVTLDKTPPQTAISASDQLAEGVTNIVSPKTMFNLASTDNLSGVKEMKYKIDSGAWKTYMADFGLSSLSVGTHTISYKSVDNVLNEETEKTITVKLISIDVTKEIYSKPVVLAGAWHVVDGEEHDHHHHKDKMKDTENAINNLANILASSGVAYYIPQNDKEFKETFRSGRYNTYILVNFQDELLDGELAEAVNYGDGLIFVKTTPYEDPSLDVFGVNFNGKTRHRELTVNLEESPISSAGTLQMNKKTKAVRTEIISPTAQNFGTFADGHKSYPAIISNQYGRGKVILFTFDLLNCPDQTKVASLLINSINYVKPAEYSIAASKSIPINIKLNNSAEPVDIKVTETLPANTYADSIYPQGTLAGNIITWQKTLNANEKATFSYYLNLPDSNGEYITNTELRYSANGEYRIYGNYSLSVNVQNSSSEYLLTIIAELKAIVTNNHKDKKWLRKAIEKLSDINTNASTRRQIENNIWRIIWAINDIQKLSFDSSDLRLKLDELLKVWQAKWYQADYRFRGKDKDKEEEWDEHAEYKKCKKDYDSGDDD